MISLNPPLRIENVIAFFVELASTSPLLCVYVCVSRQSSSIYSWLALCPYKYACAHVNAIALASVYAVYMRFFYRRMQLFLLFCCRRFYSDCHCSSFFQFILLGIVQMKFFFCTSFVGCCECIWCCYFYLFHFIWAKTLIGFQFLLFAAPNTTTSSISEAVVQEGA